MINHGSLPWGKQVHPLCRSRTKSVILSFGASEKVKLNAPDYGEEDTIMGPAGTSIADRFRRMALALSLQAKNFSQDPLHTLVPWTREAGLVAQAIPGSITGQLNRDRNTQGTGNVPTSDPRQPNPDTTLAGQYVGPKDMLAHNTIPGYIPRQDWQNAVRQDPLEGLLGPMQKPAPRQPEPTSGF